jgi:hypothetical protein
VGVGSAFATITGVAGAALAETVFELGAEFDGEALLDPPAAVVLADVTAGGVAPAGTGVELLATDTVGLVLLDAFGPTFAELVVFATAGFEITG